MAWMRGAAVDEDDKLSAEEARRVMRRAFRMLRPYRLEVAVAVVVMVVWTLCTLAGPFLLRYAIDHGHRVHRHRVHHPDRVATPDPDGDPRRREVPARHARARVRPPAGHVHGVLRRRADRK